MFTPYLILTIPQRLDYISNIIDNLFSFIYIVNAYFLYALNV